MAELGIAHKERENVEKYEKVYAELKGSSEGLTLDQVREALQKLNVNKTEQEIELLYNTYDRSNDNLLLEEEFVDLVSSLALARTTGLHKEWRSKKEYSDAVALVEEKEEEIAEVPTIKRKIIRKVEVPYVREVKVPIKTQKIVPKTVTKQVPVKRMVRQESTKMVEEEYIVIEKQPRKRMKTIYVPKEVEEEYFEDVEITKTRMVEVPSIEFVEIEELETVEVTENQLIEVDGFRIDQVEDVKIVEVEEEQEYEFVPRNRGEAHVIARREVGYAKKDHHLTRTFGRIYEAGDEALEGYEQDDLVDHRQRISYHTPDPNNKERTLYRYEDVDGGANRLNFMHKTITMRTRVIDGREVFGRVGANGEWEAGKWVDGRWAAGRFDSGTETWIYELDGVSQTGGSYTTSSRIGGGGSSSSSSRTTTTTTTITTRTDANGNTIEEEETVEASAELVGAAGDDEESESL